MKPITPSPSNYQIENVDNLIIVTTKAASIDSSTKILGGIMFATWFFVGLLFLNLIITGIRNHFPPLVIVLPSLVWIIVAVMFGFAIAWRIKFQETISVDSKSIYVKYKAPLFQRSFEYSSNHIQGLRTSPIPPLALWTGRIAFDYGGKTFYIGSRLTETEAKQILHIMREKFSNYSYN